MPSAVFSDTQDYKTGILPVSIASLDLFSFSVGCWTMQAIMKRTKEQIFTRQTERRSQGE